MNASPYRGKTKRFALLGHPVAHSVSPAMMRAAFDSLGLSFSYEALDVPDQAAFAAALAALRAGEYDGFTVTLPHKRAAAALADTLADSAARAGAANVLVREADGHVRAENTDAAAIVKVLDPLLATRRWALILGSGGAARAALVACETLGFRGIEVTSRSWTTPEEAWDHGRELPDVKARVEFSPWVSEWGEPSMLAASDTDLVIQATSAGMVGADPGDDVALRVPWDALAVKTVAFDAVYRPEVTPFLAMAQRNGLQVEGGLGMLVEQAVLALKLWLGVDAPAAEMRRAAANALTLPEVKRDSPLVGRP